MSTVQENRATLHWDPEVGFELDVDLVQAEVSVRMVRVPVPADGTVALRDPVELYALDTLFKSQVDVAGAPGQLDQVKVRVDGDSLHLSATVEDAETGDTQALAAVLSLERDGQAPADGGPVPAKPEEDDLDWEDEETLERLFDGAPEAMPRPADEDEDEDEDSDEVPSTGKMGGKGLAALLKALMDPDLGPTTEPPPLREVAPPADASPHNRPPAPNPAPARTPATTPRVVRAPASVEPGLMTADQEARSFLELLVGREELELAEEGEIDDLVPGAAQILQLPLGPGKKAQKLASWLLSHDAVEELYIDDDSLEELLDKW